MDFTDFQCFVKICQYRSITDAAKSVFVSQQALSARIKRFESELGASLFTRSKKGIILTDLGQQVYEGLFLRDNVSNLSHILGGLVGALAGYNLNLGRK